MDVEEPSSSPAPEAPPSSSSSSSHPPLLAPSGQGLHDFVSITVDVYDGQRNFSFGYPEQFFFGQFIVQAGQEGEIYRLAYQFPEQFSVPLSGYLHIQLSNTPGTHSDTGLVAFTATGMGSKEEVETDPSSSGAATLTPLGTKRSAEASFGEPVMVKRTQIPDPIQIEVRLDTQRIYIILDVGYLLAPPPPPPPPTTSSILATDEMEQEEEGAEVVGVE